jgi:hypothetical protein
MSDLITAGFTLFGRSSQVAEGFEEKRLDIVRLKPSGLSTFHFFADTVDTARVHGVVDKGMVFKQVLELVVIKRMFHYSREAGVYFRLIAITDGFYQQIPQQFTLELELAEHVEDLAAKSLTGLFQFVQELAINVAFAGFFGHQVPQMAYFGLSNAVDATKTLLDAIGVPR